MHRQTAIDLIVKHQVEQLSDDTRSETVLGWFEMGGFVVGDSFIENLPTELQHELSSGKMPDNPLDRKYDPLLMDGKHDRYAGVKNSYLLAYLHQHLPNIPFDISEISGEPATLFACPCCHYRTLTSQGAYEICTVCFWEDDGASEPDDNSSPNHMSVAQGQINFAKFGACDRDMLNHVDPEGKHKYLRASH
ncbi:CPCC family cysteine-rich protein [Paraglaciecola hydrolytica]|uniref:CPCC family cysteine-rich protein n=1 Tax=Paraglaciecola hydrolytica TaxID=1799789 RepID=UPI000A3DD8A6|nr:CPCC family cysteine-rich protein [Paraglaciecola hydrolytica]